MASWLTAHSRLITISSLSSFSAATWSGKALARLERIWIKAGKTIAREFSAAQLIRLATTIALSAMDVLNSQLTEPLFRQASATVRKAGLPTFGWAASTA